eukprot:CAMPEP_0197445370 /NCGR_PEP_ID=MMETSP1175-20131217/10601_1 /TAXON_ID=1003142 /ORGANISM="Triceratium dubium, Strain CCMP147" /LENGTH=1003 /DNA_ID=CAMNT_0042976317 /DNA_START=310 /DNA_END=3321 /DNA_ORIENTATION=-
MRSLCLFAAAAATAAVGAVGADEADDSGQQQRQRNQSNVRRKLSPSQVDRHMAPVHRLLQVDNNADIQGVDIFEFSQIFESDVEEEFGVKESPQRARNLWNDYAVWDYAVAADAETRYLLGVDGVELSDVLYSYLICSSVPNESARERKEDIFRVLELNVGNFEVDIRLDFIYEDVVRALQVAINEEDRTCFVGSMRASVVAVIVGLDNVKVLPLNTWSKMRQGVVVELLKRAYPEEFEDSMSSTASDNLMDQGTSVSESDAAQGSGVVDEDGLTQIEEDDKPGVWLDTDGSGEETVIDDDLDSTAKVDGSDSSLELVMCPGVPIEELGRLGTKIKDFMTRTTDGGKSFVASQTPYADMTDAQLNDLPARVRFWKKVFDAGINSQDGCESTVDRLVTTVTEAVNPGDSVGVSISMTSVATGDDYNTDVACVLGLMFGVTLLPQVCSMELTKKTNAFNDQAGSIVQTGGNGKAASNAKPFWDAGLTGNGQVVAVSDTGLDFDHCHFWDAQPGWTPNGRTDTTRRKVVQYVPFVDALDEQSGHGTHVAGTIAGRVARQGQQESEGQADGVARDAKIAFIDCSAGGSGLSIPGDKNTLLNTGVEAGARIHSASWGATLNPYRYDTMARDVDAYLAGNWDMLMIVAAGNSGRGDKARTLGSPATAKNVLAVGAGQSAGNDLTVSQRGADYMADFSSQGPTSDGRIAPQVIGPGQSIPSSNAIPSETGECEPNVLPQRGRGTSEGITYKAGTSMATPAVAGAAALVRQYFVEGYYPGGSRNSGDPIDPSGTLVKAVLINSGQTMIGKDNGGSVTQSSMYDSVQGFGRVSLLDSLRLQGRNRIATRVVDRITVPDGNRRGYQVLINSTVCTGEDLRVSLVWADPPGASGCVRCLVNDLDLTVVNQATGETFHPNGRTSKDDLNNVERVIVPSNKLLSGDSWMATVTAANLDRDEQQFSLAMSGCISFDGSGDIGLRKPGAANSIGSWLAATVAMLSSAYFLLSETGQFF